MLTFIDVQWRVWILNDIDGPSIFGKGTSSCMAYGLPLYLQPAVPSKTSISKYEQVLMELSLRTQSETLLSPAD
jgi:hypothetical protein